MHRASRWIFNEGHRFTKETMSTTYVHRWANAWINNWTTASDSAVSDARIDSLYLRPQKAVIILRVKILKMPIPPPPPSPNSDQPRSFDRWPVLFLTSLWYYSMSSYSFVGIASSHLKTTEEEKRMTEIKGKRSGNTSFTASPSFQRLHYYSFMAASHSTENRGLIGCEVSKLLFPFSRKKT